MKGELKNNSMQIVRYEDAVDRCCCVLPGDLIIEILQRLPVKSLLRFESTSKPWKFVIRSPIFIENHLIHHQKHEKKSGFNYLHLYNHLPACCPENCQPFTLCYCSPASHSPVNSPGISLISKREDGNVITSSLSHSPLGFFPQSVSIVGSANGLVCIKFCYISKTNTGYSSRCWDRCYGIWNPATRKFKLLPTPQRASSVVGNLCNTIVGFSYIPSTSSYKFVQILIFQTYDEANHSVRFVSSVQVLNLGANSWREIVCQGQDDEAIPELGWSAHLLESPRGYTHNLPQVVNGCLHWCGVPQRGEVSLVSFDLDKEVFTRTPIPYPFYARSHFMSMGRRLAIFEEDLAMFVSPDSMVGNEICFEVWVHEKRTTKSWTKRFSFGPLPRDEHPIGFWGDGEIIIRSKSEYPLGSNPYLYNPSTKEKKNFQCSETNCNFVFEPYVESLVEI